MPILPLYAGPVLSCSTPRRRHSCRDVWRPRTDRHLPLTEPLLANPATLQLTPHTSQLILYTASAHGLCHRLISRQWQPSDLSKAARARPSSTRTVDLVNPRTAFQPVHPRAVMIVIHGYDVHRVECVQMTEGIQPSDRTGWREGQPGKNVHEEWRAATRKPKLNERVLVDVEESDAVNGRRYGCMRTQARRSPGSSCGSRVCMWLSERK